MALWDSEPERSMVELVGVVCIHPELCRSIVTAIEQAGMRSVQAHSMDRVLETGIEPDVIVIYSGIISAELLEVIANAATNPARRTLVVSWDREPQRIADVLRAGADDYLSMPFAAEELIARIHAIANRSVSDQARRQEQTVAFDFSTRTVITGRKHVSLSSQEWVLLMALLDAEGHPVSVKELSGIMPGNPKSGAIVAVLSRLRRRLQENDFDAIIIETVRGIGYRALLERHHNPVDSSRKL